MLKPFIVIINHLLLLLASKVIGRIKYNIGIAVAPTKFKTDDTLSSQNRFMKHTIKTAGTTLNPAVMIFLFEVILSLRKELNSDIKLNVHPILLAMMIEVLNVERVEDCRVDWNSW